MNLLYIVFVWGACFIAVGQAYDAIQCFVCDSYDNVNCIDVGVAALLPKETCPEPNKYKHLKMRPKCMKNVYESRAGNKSAARGCAYGKGSGNSCQSIIDYGRGETCYCTEDLCNA